MTLTLQLVVAALAGFRLARAVATEAIFAPARRRLAGRAYPETGARRPVSEWVLELVSCPYCVGFWITAGVSLALSWATEWPGTVEALTVAVAASGLQAGLTTVDQRLSHH